MKTATVSDRCRECGRTIYSGQGCPVEFWCSDCCKAAEHKHLKESSTMASPTPPTCPNCRERVTHEGAHLAPSPDPVEMMRLGLDEVFCGRALGIPAIARGDVPEKTPEEIAADAEFEMSRKIAEWKRTNRR